MLDDNPAGRTKWLPCEVEYLRDRMKTLPYADIAAALGRSTNAVQKKVFSLGWSRPLGWSRKMPKPKPKPWARRDASPIVTIVMAGASYREAAGRLGVSVGVVAGAIHRSRRCKKNAELGSMTEKRDSES